MKTSHFFYASIQTAHVSDKPTPPIELRHTFESVQPGLMRKICVIGLGFVRMSYLTEWEETSRTPSPICKHRVVLGPIASRDLFGYSEKGTSFPY